MSSNRKKLRLNTVTVSLGCSSCRRPKLFNIFHPKPHSKSKTHTSHYLFSSAPSPWEKMDPRYASEYDTTTTATTRSTTTPTAASATPPWYSDVESDVKSLRAVQGFGRIGGESVAVEKDSDDPYLDFRRSMLQMILENEIYSKDDLRELLNCFLQLNSPSYHGIIVRAFTEIWNGGFSSSASSSKAAPPQNAKKLRGHKSRAF